MKQQDRPSYSKLIILPLLVAACLVSSSCKTSAGFATSDRPLHAEQIEKELGPVNGSVSSARILSVPLWPVDLSQAMEQARKSRQADAMVRVRWYEEQYNFIIFSYSNWVVYGEGVKLKAQEAPK